MEVCENMHGHSKLCVFNCFFRYQTCVKLCHSVVPPHRPKDNQEILVPLFSFCERMEQAPLSEALLMDFLSLSARRLADL